MIPHRNRRLTPEQHKTLYSPAEGVNVGCVLVLVAACLALAVVLYLRLTR